MPPEPNDKEAIAFIDGQNLFHSAKEAFGHNYPNYAPRKLAEKVCETQGWELTDIHFYTGIPDIEDDAFWNHFWTAKLGAMGTRGINTYSRHLRYRNQKVPGSDGTPKTVLVGQEKGIDIRIALDVVRLARRKAYDVALIFSQDQDLSEVADEVKEISMDQGRWIKVACAFPCSPTSRNTRGINGTDWIKISRDVYDACLDPTDYRQKN